MKFSTEVYTPFVEESKEFYCRYFGFGIKSEIDGFVVLQHLQQAEHVLMFCTPDSPFVHEIYHPRFCGHGILFQLEVDDIEAEYHRIRNLGLAITLPLTEDPVNGKHFTITDPNGVLVDLVQFL